MASGTPCCDYAAPLELRTEAVIYGAPMERPWPDTKRHFPWYETTSPPPGAPVLPPFPALPVLTGDVPGGMPEQCRARLARLREEKAVIELRYRVLLERLPVIDAEIETLEKMLAAIGEAP